MIAFDTETRNLRWWEGSAFLATWSGSQSDHYAPLVDAPNGRGDLSNKFLEVLAENDVLIAAHSKFDAHQTAATLGYDIFENGHTLHDVLLQARVLHGATRWQYDLESLSKDFLPDGGKAGAKADITEIYKRIKNRTSMAHDDAFYDVWCEDPEALELYAMADTRDTWDLFHTFMPQLQADDRLWRIYCMELETQQVIYKAEHRGVAIDPDAVERLRAHHAGLEATAGAALQEHLDVPLERLEGEGSVETLREALLAAGVPLTELTESGEHLAVNQQALWAHEDHPAVAALFEWRRARKFQTTYLAPLLGRSVVHTNFRQHEAKTSRMSSAEPNLQNLPKRQDSEPEDNMRMRSIFVPRPGKAFIVCDYDQIEPRLAAWYLADPGYRKTVAEGRTYELAAAAAWGNPELFPNGSANPDDYAKGGRLDFLRPAAKMIYLAILYGGGGAAVRTQNNAMTPPEWHLDPDWVKDPDNMYDSPPQALALKKRIVASIPNFDWLASTNARRPGELMKTAKRLGHVRTLFGRKAFLQKDEDGQPKYYVLLNQLIQGSAAEVLKQGAIDVDKFLAPYGGEVLLFVHDELVCEVDADIAYELAPQVAEVMANAADWVEPRLEAGWSVTTESYAHAE